MKKGFTLLELLIVIGILAILATTVTVVLNPAELLRQARDSQRLGDLRSVHAALGMFAATATTTPLFTATTTCTAIGAPNPFNGGSCGFNNNTSVIGVGAQATSTGWVNVNFALVSGGSPLSRLPIDPINDTTSYYAFRNRVSDSTWELNANLESSKYSGEETKDGGLNTNMYEIGSAPGLDL